MQLQLAGGGTPADNDGFVDDRIAWFERDRRGVAITRPDGHLLVANHAAQEMLRSGYLALDPLQRLQLPRATALGLRFEVVGTGQRRDNQSIVMISPVLWLAVGVRSGIDRLFVTLAAMSLAEEIDIACVACDLGLSASETPVLQGLVQAVCPKEISRKLNLSVHTVRSHLRSIYAKLGVRTAAEAQFRVLRVYFAIN